MIQKFHSPVEFDEPVRFLRGQSGNAYVKVSSLSDFPAPESGEIQLEAGTNYILDGIINVGTNVILGAAGSALIGTNPGVDGILHTGDTLAIDCEDVTFYMNRCSVVCTDSAIGIHFVDPSGDYFLNILGCAFIGCNVGVLLDGGNVHVIQNTLFRDCENGIVRDNGNSIEKILTDISFFDNTPIGAGAAISILGTSGLEDLDIINCKFLSDTGTGIEVVDPDVISNKATILNNRFTGAFTPVSGFNFGTSKWELIANDRIENTRRTAYMRFTGNTTATTITTQDAWVKIGIATNANSLAGFTHTSPNRLTYVRDRPLTSKVIASLDVEAPSNNIRCEVAVFKNGTLVPDTEREIELNTQNISKAVTINSYVTFETDDYIEIFIRNRTGTQNLTVKSMAVTV